MTKDISKSETKSTLKGQEYKVQLPKLPVDFRGAQYGNYVNISATELDIFFDLFQAGPDPGGDPRAIFIERIVFPLALAKTVATRLQELIERIEKDTGEELPGPNKVM